MKGVVRWKVEGEGPRGKTSRVWALALDWLWKCHEEAHYFIHYLKKWILKNVFNLKHTWFSLFENIWNLMIFPHMKRILVTWVYSITYSWLDADYHFISHKSKLQQCFQKCTFSTIGMSLSLTHSSK